MPGVTGRAGQRNQRQHVPGRRRGAEQNPHLPPVLTPGPRPCSRSPHTTASADTADSNEPASSVSADSAQPAASAVEPCRFGRRTACQAEINSLCPVSAGHLRIDREDVVTEIRDVRLFAIQPAIVLGNAGAPAAGNGEDKPAIWHVQTGNDPAWSLFLENVAECLARVINIGEEAAAMQLLTSICVGLSTHSHLRTVAPQAGPRLAASEAELAVTEVTQSVRSS